MHHRDTPSPPPPPWATSTGQDPWGDWADLVVGGVCQRLRWLPAGVFWMGSPAEEPGRQPDEVRRQVTLAQPFWLADTACTQALWHAVTGQCPSQFRGDMLPVEQVSWDMVHTRFLGTLQRLVPGLAAVLPSEAQWEYACRAGTRTAFHWGDGPLPPGRAHHAGVPPRQPLPVRSLPPNAWGLHEMHGNVMEWCAADDPTREQRVARGGAWSMPTRHLRSASRTLRSRSSARNDLGFRLAVLDTPR